MKKFRGLVLAGLLAAVLSLGLAAGACGDDDDEETSEPVATEPSDGVEPTDDMSGDPTEEDMSGDEEPTEATE